MRSVEPMRERRTCGAARKRRRSPRAAMLLEVLISIAILMLAIVGIGSQVYQSLKTVEYTEKLNRALMLAEWVLAEMDLGNEEEDRLIEVHGEEGEGTFGERYPGFGWRIKREPTDVAELDLITLDILTGNPEEDSVEDWKVLHSVYLLRPVIAELDPADFGMPSEEEIGLFAAATPPDAAGGVGDAGELPTEVEDLLAALPSPIQDIFQRFMNGEAVPLDEVRAAFGELSAEDLLGLMMVPGLFDMLGGGIGGMGGGLLGGGGTSDIQQALQGGAGSSLTGQGNADGALRQQLENIMPSR